MFDEDCLKFSREITWGSHSDDNHSDSFSDRSRLFEDSSSSDSSVEPAPHDVPKLEAHFYYYGIRGTRHWGPKLIFRTSKDVFTAPSGPDQEPRLMQLRPVYDHDKLGKDDLWATIRSQIVECLDQRDIEHSSVDLVRFSWIEENVVKDVEDGQSLPLPSQWVGVLPDTLTSEDAFHSSNDILNLLKEHGIFDIDVAYRESIARSFSGPELFAPVSNFDPLKAVIDPVTTTLGLPIAGLNTLDNQGTMGFYFKMGEDLYAVTARHVLFPEDQGNKLYSYKAGPKKRVVLMGTRAFTKFRESIQGHIGTMIITADVLEKDVRFLTARSEGSGHNTRQVALELEETQRRLEKTRMAIEELKKFFVKVKTQWMKPRERVIGHVVWAPPISVATAPHSHTQDVCVIWLKKEKFSQNFRGNVLDLGPEIDAAKFMGLMYPRIDTPSDFDYPDERLLKLRGILSAEEIRTPNNKDHKGDPMRYVIKRGLTMLTTIGCVSGFESHVRRYFALGHRDSVEVAVYRYDNDSGPFSRSGDSGSIIVDALGKFVALLTAGTGTSDSPDITFGSPMYWLWEIIKAKYPGASLYFEDSNN